MEKSSKTLTSVPIPTVVSLPAIHDDKEDEPKKKCCTLSDEVRCVFLCCVKSWSCSLNGCEGLCSCLSNVCLCFSATALDCNKCLEYIDCDGN